MRREKGGVIANTIGVVSDSRGGRDVGPEDVKAGHGGEAGLQERPTGERHQGEGVPDLHGRGDGCGRGEITSELD